MILPSKPKESVVSINRTQPTRPELKCYVPTPVNYSKAAATETTKNMVNEAENSEL
jgi:hypothetical protein